MLHKLAYSLNGLDGVYIPLNPFVASCNCRTSCYHWRTSQCQPWNYIPVNKCASITQTLNIYIFNYNAQYSILFIKCTTEKSLLQLNKQIKPKPRKTKRTGNCQKKKHLRRLNQSCPRIMNGESISISDVIKVNLQQALLRNGFV